VRVPTALPTVTPTLRRHLLLSSLDAAHASSLVESARALKRTAAVGGAGLAPSLRGKNIALLCPDPDSPDARRFQAAAAALGARVACIVAQPAWVNGETAVDAGTARLLGRLYDAVGCEGTPADFARQLQAQLTLPVYDGLARADHPLCELLPEVAGPQRAVGDADRLALLQAVMVGSLL
jgi:ornithine carbamoyltransferase